MIVRSDWSKARRGVGNPWSGSRVRQCRHPGQGCCVATLEGCWWAPGWEGAGNTAGGEDSIFSLRILTLALPPSSPVIADSLFVPVQDSKVLWVSTSPARQTLQPLPKSRGCGEDVLRATLWGGKGRARMRCIVVLQPCKAALPKVTEILVPGLVSPGECIHGSSGIGGVIHGCSMRPDTAGAVIPILTTGVRK